jgi:hypothetical protein
MLVLAVCLSPASLTGDATGIRSPAIDRTFSDEQVSVRVTIDRDRITVVDRLRVVLDITADEAREVVLPRFESEMGDFAIVERTSSGPEIAGPGEMRFREIYVLEPFLSGAYTIPRTRVAFRARHGTDRSFREVVTDEFTVEVDSVLGGRTTPALNDIAGPMDLPVQRGKWLAVVAICVVVIVSFALASAKRRRLAAQVTAPKPPHELALGRLSDLLSEGLVERGRTGDFYRRISGIVRRYVEDRFSLRTSDRTTEEVLAGLRDSTVFDESHKGALTDFLSHCDLVKFARHEPSPEEIERTVNGTRTFITETGQDSAREEG